MVYPACMTRVFQTTLVMSDKREQMEATVYSKSDN